MSAQSVLAALRALLARARHVRRSTWLLSLFFLAVLALYFLVRPAPATHAVEPVNHSTPRPAATHARKPAPTRTTPPASPVPTHTSSPTPTSTSTSKAGATPSSTPPSVSSPGTSPSPASPSSTP